MKFSDKYPDAKNLEQYGDMLCGETFHPCWNCGTLTRWYEINYEAPLCSEECVAQKDKEYRKALTSKVSSSRIRTRLFDLREDLNVSQLASKVGLSISEVSRLKRGERRIAEKFIIGALTAFPEYKFEEMFYIEK